MKETVEDFKISEKVAIRPESAVYDFENDTGDYEVKR